MRQSVADWIVFKYIAQPCPKSGMHINDGVLGAETHRDHFILHLEQEWQFVNRPFLVEAIRQLQSVSLGLVHGMDGHLLLQF